MPVVRLVAECADDTASSAGCEYKIVFDAVYESGKIKEQMCFGYYFEIENKVKTSWPFILRKVNEKWVLDYGSYSNTPFEPINIFEKDIVHGCYFSVGEAELQTAYRIIQINYM
ncbi:MAG: hypothetical protein U1E99_10730 [Agitococcus sp.]